VGLTLLDPVSSSVTLLVVPGSPVSEVLLVSEPVEGVSDGEEQPAIAVQEKPTRKNAASRSSMGVHDGPAE
jgi:hypothetical protein